MGLKYEFTDETTNYYGRILHRIKRHLDCRIGGWIEKEENLSQEGNCWVDDNARVSGEGIAAGNAKIYGDAWVEGYARVCGKAKVYDNARVRGVTCVREEAEVFGNAEVFGDMKINSALFDTQS